MGNSFIAYKDYLALVQDKNYTSLYNYYSQETVMDILGVARQENPHSNFLRWLLDMRGEHSLGSLPVRKLLETVCFVAEDLYGNGEKLNVSIEKTSWLDNETLLNALKFGRYEILNQFIANEVVLKKQRRADIFSLCELDIPRIREKKYLVILIENKIHSLEGNDGDGQTVKYADDMKDTKSIFRGLKDKLTWLPTEIDEEQLIKVYIYLNAFPKKTIKNAYIAMEAGNKENPVSIAKSREFITINYQYLLDGMIEPLLGMTSDDVTRFRLKDYVRCLGQAKIAPIQEQDKEPSDSEYLIMAVSKYEKERAIALWDKHHSVIRPILQTLAKKSETKGFMLSESDKSFWITLANLYGLIADDYFPEDEARYINDLISAIKYPFATKYSFNVDTYQKRVKDKNIGRLCRDVMEDFVKNHIVMMDDAASELKKIREDMQSWHPWLYEGILFDCEVKLIEDKPQEYKPNFKRHIASKQDFKDVFFYESPIEGNGFKFYVAKYWAIETMQKLLRYLDDNYSCCYTEKVIAAG